MNGIWIMILCCDLLMVPIVVVCGYAMLKCASKQISALGGYRSKRSMKNSETWRFANQYCGKLWIRLGLGMLIPSVLVHIPFRNSSETVLAILCVVVESIQIAVVIGSILFVEKALKKQFTDAGIRRQGPEIF